MQLFKFVRINFLMVVNFSKVCVGCYLVDLFV